MAICRIGHRNVWRLQRRFFAAAAFATGMTASASAIGGPVDQVSERSKTLIGPTIAFEDRAARAVVQKSLADLENLYADIALHQVPVEKLIDEGIDACGCDVALTNLSVIVGFAIDKLDRQGRYQPWMLAESLRLLEEYQGFVSDCAKDAGMAAGPRPLTAQQLKAL